MPLTIHPFEPTLQAYAALVALHKTLSPDERPLSPARWQIEDAEWPAGWLLQRFVAQDDRDGSLVGMASCFESYWQHQPGTVHIELHAAHPPGADALFHHMCRFLAQRTPPPTILATRTREDHPARIQFLESRGFTLALRSPRSYLQLDGFDFTPFAQLEARLAKKRIVFGTLQQLIENDPDWKQKLYELRWALIQDVPAVEPPTKPTLAEFETMILDDPALEPDAWFVALHTGRWVGMSNLWLNDEKRQRLDVGLTGVLPTYRRQGLATVLKLHTIRFGRSIGAATIETSNAEHNPMFGLNLKLGFQPRPASLSYRAPFESQISS